MSLTKNKAKAISRDHYPESITPQYGAYVTAFSQISLFLHTHGNTISRENLNSGSYESYAKFKTGKLNLWVLRHDANI